MTTRLLSGSGVVPGHPHLAGSVEPQCPGSPQVSFPGQLPRGSDPSLLPLLSKVACQVNDHCSKTMAEMNPGETTKILVPEMEQASLSLDSAGEWSCHSQPVPTSLTCSYLLARKRSRSHHFTVFLISYLAWGLITQCPENAKRETNSSPHT